MSTIHLLSDSLSVHFVSVWLPKHLKIFKTMQVSGIILCEETAEWNITVIKQSFYTIN